MNFLAHLYLAGTDEELMVGNMLGDFVDSDFTRQYPPDICSGIYMHREIDKFTDHHPVFLRSRRRLDRRFRLLTGIIIDMFYDHYLAKHWQNYHPQTLEEYSRHVYSIFQKHQALLPARLKQMLPRMVSQNWLLSYRTERGISEALRGLATRLSRPNRLAESFGELQRLNGALENDFEEFFPQLVTYAKILREKTKE